MEAEKIFFNIICYSRELLIETASFKLGFILAFPPKPCIFKASRLSISSNRMYFPLFFPLRVETRESFFTPRWPTYPAALRMTAWPPAWSERRCSSWY